MFKFSDFCYACIYTSSKADRKKNLKSIICGPLQERPHSISLNSHNFRATASSLAFAPISCAAQQEK